MSRMNEPRLSTHVDLEHLFKVGDRVDHVVGPFLLDGDSSAVNTSRELSVTGFELLGKVLLGGFDSLHRHTNNHQYELDDQTSDPSWHSPS